tara:strand:- start:45 stop:482 length:438 start_codon:yes stop_codon:yes gene_type:complete
MAMSDRMKSIADMTASMSTRGPDRTIDQPTDDVRTSRLMNLIRGMNIDSTDKPDMRKMSMPTRSPDGSIKAREVEVAGEFEDLLMKNYEEAVEQGYKGTFFDFLIDRMDEDFDPASPMRVSRLAEEMKGIPSVMDMKMLRKMITG